jgi:hypothetical protein
MSERERVIKELGEAQVLIAGIQDLCPRDVDGSYMAGRLEAANRILRSVIEEWPRR